MASKKTNTGSQTKQTFVVGRIYAITHTEGDEKRTDDYVRYVGPSTTYPDTHLLERAGGEVTYASTHELEDTTV